MCGGVGEVLRNGAASRAALKRCADLFGRVSLSCCVSLCMSKISASMSRFASLPHASVLMMPPGTWQKRCTRGACATRRLRAGHNTPLATFTHCCADPASFKLTCAAVFARSGCAKALQDALHPMPHDRLPLFIPLEHQLLLLSALRLHKSGSFELAASVAWRAMHANSGPTAARRFDGHALSRRPTAPGQLLRANLRARVLATRGRPV